MSYGTSYTIRYNLGTIWHQTEVAAMIAAQAILDEPANTTNHAQRLKWANWANTHSGEAFVGFLWPIAQDTAITSAVEAKPDGSTVTDADIQRVVNASLNEVVNGWTEPLPPA